MRQNGVECSAYTELVQQAARVDRISGEIEDPELSRGFSALRGCLDRLVTILADRHELPEKTTTQLIHERRFPWDR